MIVTLNSVTTKIQNQRIHILSPYLGNERIKCLNKVRRLLYYLPFKVTFTLLRRVRKNNENSSSSSKDNSKNFLPAECLTGQYIRKHMS